MPPGCGVNPCGILAIISSVAYPQRWTSACDCDLRMGYGMRLLAGRGRVTKVGRGAFRGGTEWTDTLRQAVSKVRQGRRVNAGVASRCPGRWRLVAQRVREMVDVVGAPNGVRNGGSEVGWCRKETIVVWWWIGIAGYRLSNGTESRRDGGRESLSVCRAGPRPNREGRAMGVCGNKVGR